MRARSLFGSVTMQVDTLRRNWEAMMADTSVRVTPRRRFAQFLILKPATVELDGAVAGSAKWGQPAIFPAGPGAHRVLVYFPYLGKKRCGEATLEVDVAEGQVVDLVYRSPWVITMRGSITAGSE